MSIFCGGKGVAQTGIGCELIARAGCGAKVVEAAARLKLRKATTCVRENRSGSRLCARRTTKHFAVCAHGYESACVHCV